MKKINLLLASLLVGVTATAIEPKDVTIYINPGHGGHDSDDRNVVIEPYVQGDPEGFWESNSNLDKGLMLRDLLEAKGCKVFMSRVTNTSADDLGLTTIGKLANEKNADMFFSIHSNATGTGSRVNYTLMLFRGFTETPENPKSKEIAKILGDHLITNKATVWTSDSPSIYGDFSFGGFGSGPTGGLGVLRALTIPGMLSEGSFHDYIPETYRLMNKDFKWNEAWNFMKAVNQYMGLPGQTIGHIAGCIYDNRILRNASYIMHSRDVQEPINNAKVQLIDGTGNVKEEYTTDALFNGFYSFKNIEPGDYKVRVIKDTHYTSETSVTVIADQISYNNIPLNKVRSTAPEVLTYSPAWQDGDVPMLCNTPVSFTFNWDMDITSTEKAFTISPAVKGTFEWKDSNYQLTFTPSEPYQENTVYTVTLNKAAQHGGGMIMANDLSFKFKTDERRFLVIKGQSPQANDEIHYDGTVIMLQTDKVMDQSGLSTCISLYDAKGTEVLLYSRKFKCNKNTDTYGWLQYPVVDPLNIGETYTLKIASTLADRDGIKIDGEKNIKFTAVDAAAEKVGSTLVCDFENAALFTYDTENSVACTSASALKDTSSKLFGTACTNFKYTFSGKDDGIAKFSLASPMDVVVTSKDKIGIHINGDMSWNNLFAVFTDGTETKEINIADLQFFGWKYITIDPIGLDAGKEYKLIGIKIVQKGFTQGVTGAIKLDNIVILKGESGVNDAEISSLTIYPNPASEYIIANADTLIEGLDLIAMNGAVVSKVIGNIMNVSEIADGNYIVRIKVASGNITKKITIAH